MTEARRLDELPLTLLEPLPPHLGWALRCGDGGEEHGTLLSEARDEVIDAELDLGTLASSHVQVRMGRRKDQSFHECPTLLFTKLFKAVLSESLVTGQSQLQALRQVPGQPSS